MIRSSRSPATLHWRPGVAIVVGECRKAVSFAAKQVERKYATRLTIDEANWIGKNKLLHSRCGLIFPRCIGRGCSVVKTYAQCVWSGLKESHAACIDPVRIVSERCDAREPINSDRWLTGIISQVPRR